MLDALQARKYDESLLAEASKIDCGNEEWSRYATEWLRKPPGDRGGALHGIINRGNLVWLFYSSASQAVVGFGSLGSNKIAQGGDQKIKAAYIPMLGIHHKFRGHPKNCEPSQRYSSQIIKFLYLQARDIYPAFQILFLQVHRENNAAKKLYARMGFQVDGAATPSMPELEVMFIRLR